MVTLGKEMERQGFDVPLMIGGATTSKAHTAVKIAPTYQRNQTIYVSDASRAVGVASKLISKESRDAFVAEIQRDYEAVRLRTANRTSGYPLRLLGCGKAETADQLAGLPGNGSSCTGNYRSR